VKLITFHPEARLELTAAGRYYAERSLNVAQRFYAEMDEILAEVRARPSLRRMFDPPARRHSGPIFPYCVVYVEKPDSVWILAVMHFKQAPGYWRERIS
jgi:toxin ParE1/3/4